MTCWVWIESGECVDAVTHEEGVALLQASNPHCVVRAEDVLDDDAAYEVLVEEKRLATVELVQLLAPRV